MRSDIMSWEDILKRGNIRRPPSNKKSGRKMSGFSTEDADEASERRKKLMDSPEAEAARIQRENREEQERYRNSPEGKAEQSKRDSNNKKAKEYGKLMCRDCGTNHIADSDFKDDCDACGSEGKDNFAIIEYGKGTEGYRGL